MIRWPFVHGYRAILCVSARYHETCRRSCNGSLIGPDSAMDRVAIAAVDEPGVRADVVGAYRRTLCEGLASGHLAQSLSLEVENGLCGQRQPLPGLAHGHVPFSWEKSEIVPPLGPRFPGAGSTDVSHDTSWQARYCHHLPLRPLTCSKRSCMRTSIPALPHRDAAVQHPAAVIAYIDQVGSQRQLRPRFSCGSSARYTYTERCVHHRRARPDRIVRRSPDG